MLCAEFCGLAVLWLENSPPNLPWLFPPPATVADCCAPYPACAGPLANGRDLVFLCALFSLSCIFFRNCLASFSSAKLRPNMQSSPSNEWKNVRSWL